MLEYLRIQNLALIEDMELEFSPGLNVLSGETGAGKTFILKALNFLTGDKLSADMVRQGEDKARVEALFSLSGEDYVIRRELVASTGRSRLFINDSLSSQEAVKNLKSSLLLHAGQHGQQKLLQPSYQARILDGFLQDDTAIRQKDRLLVQLRELAAKKEELEERSHALAEKRELLEYQRTEIEKVHPEPGEEENLEQRKRSLKERNAAQESQMEALSILTGTGGPDTGILSAISRLERFVRTVADFSPDLKKDPPILSDIGHQLSDMEARLRQIRVVAPEDDIEKIESRLYELAQLKRTLKRSLDDIVQLKQEIEENLSFLDSCNLDLKQLEKQEKDLAGQLEATLAACNSARRSAADDLTQALEKELRRLGFSEHIQVFCEFTAHEVYPSLFEDRARFLWLPNPGQAAQPLDKIASGGELSRFLLAVVGLMARAELPTLLFDEVDSGVGGVTLMHVGERLQALSRRQQMILISHWPQLASLAEKHFQVRKEVRGGQTFTLCEHLTGDEIFQELARMAGGGDKGEALARKLQDN